MPKNYEDIQRIKQDVFEPQKARAKTPKLFIVVGTVVAAVIIIFSAISVFTPKNTIVPQGRQFTVNIDNTTTRLTSIRFDGQEPQLPTQLPLVQRAQSLSSELLTERILSKYQLVAHNQVPEFWTSGQASLNVDTPLNQFTLALGESGDGLTLPVVNQELAIESAQTLLKDLFPELELKPIESKVQYVAMADEYADTTPEKATGLIILFTQYIGDYPVFNQRESRFPFLVTIDGNNRILKVLFSGKINTFQATEQNADTISLEQAFENIKATKASIIDSTFVDAQISLSQLTSATFSTATIEYRDDTTTAIAYPFYRLTGTGATADGKQISIEVITPAVQTTTAQN